MMFIIRYVIIYVFWSGLGIEFFDWGVDVLGIFGGKSGMEV